MFIHCRKYKPLHGNYTLCMVYTYDHRQIGLISCAQEVVGSNPSRTTKQGRLNDFVAFCL